MCEWVDLFWDALLDAPPLLVGCTVGMHPHLWGDAVLGCISRFWDAIWGAGPYNFGCKFGPVQYFPRLLIDWAFENTLIPYFARLSFRNTVNTRLNIRKHCKYYALLDWALENTVNTILCLTEPSKKYWLPSFLGCASEITAPLCFRFDCALEIKSRLCLRFDYMCKLHRSCTEAVRRYMGTQYIHI